MKWTPERIAGAAYVLPALATGGIWYVLLFMHNPPEPNYGEMLRTWFIEIPERRFFWWLVLLPALCLTLAAAYFSPIARKKVGAAVLCTLGIVTAAAAWLAFDSSIAIFVTLPLLFTVPSSVPSLISGARPLDLVVMRLRLTNPRCPICSKELTFLHSVKFLNPWNCKCPHCSGRLEMTTRWKWVHVGYLILGGALASVAIYQEEMGRWQASDSLMFFFWAFIISLPVSCAIWPLTGLRAKRAA
jgi:hypothetical protein